MLPILLFNDITIGSSHSATVMIRKFISCKFLVAHIALQEGLAAFRFEMLFDLMLRLAIQRTEWTNTLFDWTPGPKVREQLHDRHLTQYIGFAFIILLAVVLNVIGLQLLHHHGA